MHNLLTNDTMRKNLTLRQVRRAIYLHDYLLVTDEFGVQFTVNCKVARLFEKRKKYEPGAESFLISYKPISLNECITRRISNCNISVK